MYNEQYEQYEIRILIVVAEFVIRVWKYEWRHWELSPAHMIRVLSPLRVTGQ